MHSPDPVAVKRYFVYIYLGKDRYYANRSDNQRIRWSTKQTEYPDFFTNEEAGAIKYKHNEARFEETYVILEDD